MSEIKDFFLVGCGEMTDKVRIVNYFYIVIQDEEFEYQITFDREVFESLTVNLKFPLPVKLDLRNCRILKQIPKNKCNLMFLGKKHTQFSGSLK